LILFQNKYSAAARGVLNCWHGRI